MAKKSVRVRMYRTGLGDCFLLTFPGKTAARPVHMLVDCGVFYNTPGEKDRMRQIAQHISDTTKGRLDILVATHEHYDHLVGFKHARDIFEAMTIDRVWLSWIERPGEPRAAWLRAIEEKLHLGLRTALAQAKADPALAARAAGLEGLLEFGGGPLAADYSEQIGEVKRWLRDGTGGTVEYLEPHQAPIEIAPDVRVFALGPPVDEGWFRKMNDSTSKPETYHADFALSAVPAFFDLAGRRAPESSTDPANLAEPFDKAWQIPAEAARQDPFFAGAYGFNPADPTAWRRIDADWLAEAETLALQLDSLTNNSSLALAIEVGKARRVLLMAADAQVGNWLSWHEGTWTVPGAGGGGQDRTVTAADLLARTVLYKVGHHGSHNATLRQRGLELMTSEELVAMIPVDQAYANNVKKWKMPFPPLLAALEGRARGRILRADLGLPANGAVEQAARKRFFARSGEDPLFVEHRVDL